MTITSIARRWARLIPLVAALTVTVPATVTSAQTPNPYQRGPAPTASSLRAANGPFSVSSSTISDLATPGFGAATIYSPNDTSQGTFGGVVVAPGYTASRSTMAWLAQRVATHGFVVINIDTNSRYDYPASRGDQIRSAVDYLRSVSSNLDGNRIGVMGHSMGGGGTLEAIADDPSIDAAVPLTPWNTDKSWGEVTTPTMIIGAENDSVASVSSHAVPFYNSLSSSLDRAYLELNNASHFAPNSRNDVIGMYSVAWLKLYVDDDTRYETFVCPGPGTGSEISDYESDCGGAGGNGGGGGTGSEPPWWCWWC